MGDSVGKWVALSLVADRLGYVPFVCVYHKFCAVCLVVIADRYRYHDSLVWTSNSRAYHLNWMIGVSMNPEDIEDARIAEWETSLRSPNNLSWRFASSTLVSGTSLCQGELDSYNFFNWAFISACRKAVKGRLFLLGSNNYTNWERAEICDDPVICFCKVSSVSITEWFISFSSFNYEWPMKPQKICFIFEIYPSKLDLFLPIQF